MIRRGLTVPLALLLGAGPLASPSSADTSAAPISSAPPPVQITTSPGLFPAYSPTISDYVIRCTGGPIPVAVTAPEGYSVAVAGQPATTGTFAIRVTATTRQTFTIGVTDPGGATTTAHVRCLPLDFPTWTPLPTVPGSTPQAQFYVVTPITPNGPNGAEQYLTLFDTNDVPVWWINTTSSAGSAAFGTFLPNGDVAWTTGNGSPAVERALDGTLVRSIGAGIGQTDEHELIQLPNGDDLVGARVVRQGADLSSWGTDAAALTNVPVFDFVLQELAPSGAVVWSWDAYDHISVSETDPQWRATLLAGGAPYDVYHWNSLEADGASLIASFRHLDAVYNIDRTTGTILWKLGGTTRADGTSLAVIGDPVFASGSGFGGQHDARVLPDGSVTLFDDQTNRGAPPRAVRYVISPGSATLAESLADPLVTNTVCCGSARKLPGGDWVLSAGFTPIVTELTPSGERAWGMRLPSTLSYRTIPVMSGVLTIDQLRQGMDAQAGGRPSASRAITLTRLSGVDATGTAVAISQHDWAQWESDPTGPTLTSRSASAVVIAGSAPDSTDAQVAVPLAVAKGAPLLLNGPSDLDPRNLGEIARVLPPGGPISIVGGPAVVSSAVEHSLQALGYEVTRLAGPDRYSTAVAVANVGLGNPPTIVEATGHGVADAQISGPVASHIGGALLLTGDQNEAEATSAYLSSNSAAVRYAIGGPAALADPGATAIVGADRYQTATMAATQFFPSPPPVVGIADGEAATAGASIGFAGGALLLSTATIPAPASTSSYLDEDPALVAIDEYGSATIDTIVAND